MSFIATVAVITNNKGEILLGQSLSKDWRFGTMCFPGGKIEPGESHDRTTLRETFEEASIVCDINSCKCHHFEDFPNICFVTCKHFCGDPQPNEEFEYLQWVSLSNLPSNIAPQNLEILKRLGMLNEKVVHL